MVREYETREVTHGNAWGAFATITKDETTGDVTFGTPYVFTGLRANNFETTEESNPFYADNQEHIRLSGAKSTEGSITVYQIPRKFLTDHLGKKEMTNGGYTDTGIKKSFVWQYIETVTDEFGNETEELHVWYNVKASAPTAGSNTDEDTAEPKEIEIPVTASPNNAVLDPDGKAVSEFVIRRTAANSTLFDTAYTKVVMPSDVVAAG